MVYEIIFYLHFIAVKLFFLFSGYAAVGRHPFARILRAMHIDRLNCGWDCADSFLRHYGSLFHLCSPF